MTERFPCPRAPSTPRLKHHLAGTFSGGTPETGNPKYWSNDESGIAWVAIGDMSSCERVESTEKRITHEGRLSRGLSILPEGTLVYSMYASLGHVAELGIPAAINQALIGFEFKPGVNKNYVKWQLKYLQARVIEEASTSTQDNLNAEKVGNLPVPLPPIAIQDAIAKYLDDEISRIDALLAAKQRVLDLLTEKRKAIIATAVTRGLDPNARMAPTGVEWTPEAPWHWRPSRIGRMFRQSKLLGYPDLTILSVYRDFGVIERSSRDDNANVLPDDLTKYQLVEAGDLVVNKMKAWQGSLGISELRGITSPDYVVFRPSHSELPAYLHFMLRTPQLTTVYLSNSNGIRTNQWRIEPERFLNIAVMLPPLDEQQAIVAHITHEAAKIDAVRAATERTIALLKERRAALIAAAVTGQLDLEAAA